MEIENVFERSKNRSECSSVEELRNKIKNRENEIRHLYDEKQKEMNFWKGDEAEVSWCDKHESWCEVVKECSPKDPIPQPPVVGVHKNVIFCVYIFSCELNLGFCCWGT